jgi:hypothetical protein
MKRLFLCLVLVFGFAQFNYLSTQEEQVEQFHLGSITDIPATEASTQGVVVPLLTYIGTTSNVWWSIDYTAGDIWYMYIAVVNTSPSTQSFKLEFDLRYGDGVGYRVYRCSQSVAGLSWDSFRLNVTSYVAKLGLLTLTGRVYGKGMGNDSKVTGQVYVY